MGPVALGIDVGTGSTKAGLVDQRGGLVAVARAAHEVRQRRPGWSETEPGEWLASATDAVAEVLADRDVRVEAVGLSGQMHGVVVCDGDGQPLRPAVLWSDRRAQDQLEALRERLGADLLSRLGNPLVAGMAGPSVAALAASEPEILARTRSLLQPKDWLRLQLTGVVATDPTDASATLLWDTADDGWSTEACEAFDVRPDWLPNIRPSHAGAGEVTPEAAARFGIPTGTPVAVGAADTAAALLGAGLATGETQVSTGTGGQIARLLDRPVADERQRTHLYRAASPGRWYAMAAIQNAGIAVDWALEVLESDLEAAAAAVAASPPGARGVVFVPYLTGERTPHMDADRRGGWTNLHPGATRDDLVRAVFEGVAYALRDGLDALCDLGHDIDEALLAGGGSTADWWRRLLADVLGIPLTPHDATDASVRGAALLAWRTIDHEIEPGAAVTRARAVEPRDDYTVERTRFHEAVAALAGPSGLT